MRLAMGASSMLRKRSTAPLLAVVVGLLGAAPARAELLQDARLGFKVTVPDGFADYPAGKQQPGTLYSYVRGTPGTSDFAIVSIKPMGGTIGRDPLLPSELPHVDGVEFTVRPEKWKSFHIEVLVGVARQTDLALLVQVAQVPLKHEAIQLLVVGPEAHRAELNALLQTLLASLDGQSSWLTDAERSYRLGKAVGLVVGFVLALSIALWLVWRLRKRPRTPVPRQET